MIASSCVKLNRGGWWRPTSTRITLENADNAVGNGFECGGGVRGGGGVVIAEHSGGSVESVIEFSCTVVMVGKEGWGCHICCTCERW